MMNNQLRWILAFLGLLAFSTIPLFAQSNIEPIDVVGGDEAALREFISRALTPLYGLQPEDERLILIGELPVDLPYEVPLPDNTRVIGSMVLGEAVGTQILLDSSLPATDVVEFYEQVLLENGWQAIEQGNRGSGFTTAAATGTTFCDADDNALMVTAVEIGDSTDVRIQTQSPAQYGQCNPSRGMNTSEGENLLPSLEAPAGTVMRGGGSSGGSSGEWGISAFMETELTAEELAAIYNDQLETRGWTLVQEGSTEGAAWSNWTFSDEDGDTWAGTLIVLESPSATDGRSAFLQIGPVRE